MSSSYWPGTIYEPGWFLFFGRSPSPESVEYTLRYSTESGLGSLPSRHKVFNRFAFPHLDAHWASTLRDRSVTLTGWLRASAPFQAACAGIRR